MKDRPWTLTQIGQRIRTLEKRNIANVAAIGRLLRAAQDQTPDGKWIDWLQREFQWSDRTARRYIACAKMVEGDDPINPAAERAKARSRVRTH